MTTAALSTSNISAVFTRGAVAAALLAVSAAASALPGFTFDPAAVGLTGDSFTADNLLIADYALVTNSGTSFTESGFLRITGAQFGDDTLVPTGLNKTYSLYISFTGTGHTDGANPLTGPTSGTFDSLTYTMWAADGNAGFSVSGATPTTTATSPIKLASGSLVAGTVGTQVQAPSFAPTANAVLSFSAEASGFFASPSPFYNRALTSFSNTSSQVETFTGGFKINKGGGSINFATAVPEPESYAMLLAGLAVVGSLAKRRRR